MSDGTPVTESTERRIRKFVHFEAQLIDQRRFEEWLELFADDGLYWIPSRPDQTDARTVPSIVYEDRALLTIRVKRLRHPKAYAALPAPRTIHVVGNLEVHGHDGPADEIRVASNVMIAEHQQATTRTFAGACEHILRDKGDRYEIVLKRIDLIDCDAVHGIMTSLL